MAWVSLDKQDNDWIQFWSYITASIQERISDFGKPVWSLLEKGSLVSLEPAIKALLNELNQLTGELVIILDDYQFIELPDIHHSLTYLLKHLPPHNLLQGCFEVKFRAALYFIKRCRRFGKSAFQHQKARSGTPWMSRFKT